MKADKTIAIYRRMQAQPLWRLLASNNGPMVIGLLQSHLYESERSLPASIFQERIARNLEELRAQGEDFPQTAQAYIASWLSDGYLKRHFPTGASEEEYELSTATVEAIRFLFSQIQPHSAATESRLTLVIDALVKLAEDTDTDKSRRIERLMAEQTRINQEIDAIQAGKMRALPPHTALERTREIITLADDLAGDFRRVRDQFEQLNRELSERIMDNDSNRGDVLDALFTGMDLISESDAGRTFSAFGDCSPIRSKLQSVLMDEDTLLRHKTLWVNEAMPHSAAELVLLTEQEQQLYRHLKQQRWGKMSD